MVVLHWPHFAEFAKAEWLADLKRSSGGRSDVTHFTATRPLRWEMAFLPPRIATRR
jgi:hypothetical protein